MNNSQLINQLQEKEDKEMKKRNFTSKRKGKPVKLKVVKIENYTKEYYKAGQGWITYTYDEPIYILEKVGE